MIEKLDIEDWTKAEAWLTDQIKTYYMVLRHGRPHAINELRATKKDDAGLVMSTSPPPVRKSSSSSSSSNAAAGIFEALPGWYRFCLILFLKIYFKKLFIMNKKNALYF